MTMPSPDEKAIFNAARQLGSAEARCAYLAQACGQDGNLRARVAALLRVFEDDKRFLESPADLLQATCDDPMGEAPGTAIGPYKLLEQIGEGGFGVVFMAEQQQPVRRKVALKVLKPGMDTRQVIARFEAERQALALMEHANIAQVFDGGETAAGRPYFVMELVKGIPITDYCDQDQLTPRQRLELFLSVCQAVQHAHQKGIIHRDLKPSNILVTRHDGTPVVKVIDFGIAKATGQQLTDKTLFTHFAQLLGTPLYISPEQAALSGLDVDTRTDIYSLGVVLYELLTGTTPFEKQRFKEADYDEMRRIIREEEPPKPSTRMSTLGLAATTLSTQRQSDPKRLSRLFRGELDWIVMKCLEKDRSRRYETANELALDVQRYLADEPVQACPPSVSYRLCKFVQRHRRAVAAAALASLVLIIGTGVATWQAIVATQAKQQALLAAAAAKEAKELADAKEAQTQAALDFVQSKVFAAARPKSRAGGLGPEVSLRAALEAALPYVEKSFRSEPLIEARLRMTLGLSFYHLGDAKTAAEQFQKARAIYLAHSDQANSLKSMTALADTYMTLSRNDEALQLHQEAFAVRKATLGLDHPDTLASMMGIADCYYGLRRFHDAAKLLEENLALRKRRLATDHPDTLRSMHNLANAYYALGRRQEALALREQTLALRKATLRPDDPEMLTSMMAIGNSYYAAGQYARATKLLEETVELQKANLGVDHPYTLASMNNLGNCYTALQRHAEALKLRLETLALSKARRGEDHPKTLECMSNLANTYWCLRRYDDAITLGRETLTRQKARLGADDPETLRTMNNLAGFFRHTGRHIEALKLHEETLALRKAKLGIKHPDTFWSVEGVALGLIELDRAAEAVALIDDYFQQVAGTVTDPRISSLADTRLRLFEKRKDAVGCQSTAQVWEKLQLKDAQSLYNAARYRAVTAAILRADSAADAAKQADTEAERAMTWLHQAVAAGYKDADKIKENRDLAALRDRADFKTMLEELQAGTNKDN